MGMMTGGWGGMGGVFGGISMLFMGIVPLLVLGLLVWLVLEATRRRDQGPSGPAPSAPAAFLPDARSILDERYAKGEMDRQEYLERRRDLNT